MRTPSTIVRNVFVAATVLLPLMAVAGCPSDMTAGSIDTGTGAGTDVGTDARTGVGTGTGADTGAGNSSSGGSVVVSDFQIQPDGMVAAGDGIVAFGSTPGGLSGVSVWRVGDAAATKIGDYRGDAVYCAGKKVVVVANKDVNRISVYDSTSGATAEVPDSDVFDIAPGGNLENAYIAVDGHWVAYLNRGGPNGAEVAVADISGPTPVVTTFAEPLINPSHLDVDGTTGDVALMEDNQFITIFGANSAADTPPTRIDIHAAASVSLAYLPKLRISNGHVLFAAFSTNDVYLCDVKSQQVTPLNLNPSASLGAQQLAIRGDVFAYALDRDTSDLDETQGTRLATGSVSNPGAVAAASGASLGNGARAGFGTSIAILPSGAIFVAGRMGQSLGAGLLEPSALQANTGSGYQLLGTTQGTPLPSADVVASGNVVAFKVVYGDLDVRVGYYQTK